MIKEIHIGCASTNTHYGKRLDTTLVKLNSKANFSALFTSNKFKSAPVQICLNQIKKKMKGEKILAINAGNANAATGRKGVSDTKKLIKEISNLSNIPTDQILPFSTGVVGQVLDMKSLSKGFNESFKNLNKNSWNDFVGVAKGVGMIEPNMATTLSYIFTDLKISESFLKKIHKEICDKTFNAVSIDGDQSPSDSSILVATGLSEVDAKKNLKKIKKDIYSVFQKLSEKLVLDGEGSTKLLKITVKGLSSESNCKKIAMKIANSPLVKTAAFGEDPNWGRVIVAAGNAEIDEFNMEKLSLKVGKFPVLVNGNLSKKYKESQGQKEFRKRKINLELSMGKSKHSFTVIGSDLTKDYISINSDYRS